ncbi:hypothetical protein FACS1894166_08290 [Bacilli bacterium]|nr:hypothetical protein FACS1894166_08290 [Bacilli bacterium]
MYICSITSNPDSLIYKGSTEVMFNTYRASLSSAEFTTTDLGNFTNGKSTVVLSKFKSVNKDSEAATI